MATNTISLDFITRFAFKGVKETSEANERVKLLTKSMKSLTNQAHVTSSAFKGRNFAIPGQQFFGRGAATMKRVPSRTQLAAGDTGHKLIKGTKRGKFGMQKLTEGKNLFAGAKKNIITVTDLIKNSGKEGESSSAKIKEGFQEAFSPDSSPIREPAKNISQVMSATDALQHSMATGKKTGRDFINAIPKGKMIGFDEAVRKTTSKLGKQAVALKKNKKGFLSFSRSMGMLSVLFASQQIFRQMSTLTTSTVGFYMEITKAQTQTGQSITALSANFQFLKFSIGEAIGAILGEWLPGLIELMANVREFVSAHPKMVGWIVMFLLIGTVVAMATAQMVLLGAGIQNMAGAKNLAELGRMIKELGVKAAVAGKGIATSMWGFAIAHPILAIIIALLAIAVALWAAHPGAIKKFKEEAGLANNVIKGMIAHVFSMLGFTIDVEDAWTAVAGVVSYLFTLIMWGVAMAAIGFGTLTTVIGMAFHGVTMGWNTAMAGLAAGMKWLVTKWNWVADKLGRGKIPTKGLDDWIESSVDKFEEAKTKTDNIWSDFEGSVDFESMEELNKRVRQGPQAAIAELLEEKKQKQLDALQQKKKAVGDETMFDPKDTPEGTFVEDKFAGNLDVAKASADADKMIADAMANSTAVTDQFQYKTNSVTESMNLMAGTAKQSYNDVSSSILSATENTKELGTATLKNADAKILPKLDEINIAEAELLKTLNLQSAAFATLGTSIQNFHDNGYTTEILMIADRLKQINTLNESYEDQIYRLERIIALQSQLGNRGGSSYSSQVGTNAL